METTKIKVVLAGNPNSGKSTLFNALIGLRQKVGNYPGITVEKKTGSCNLDTNTKLMASLIYGAGQGENKFTEAIANGSYYKMRLF